MSRPFTPGKGEDPRYNIRAIDRALRILSLLSDGRSRTLAEISEGIELSASTTFRMLSTLGYYGYVSRDEKNNTYKLGLACLELAQGFALSNDLRQVALPALELLRDETKETVHLVVMDNMQIIYLEKIPGLHAIGIMTSRVGLRSPAYCTAVGKMLLAYQREDQIREYYATHSMRQFTETTITNLETLLKHLESVRCQGYALDIGEHEDEVRCVAAPVFDMNSKAVAAISISGPSIRMDPIETNQDLIERARRTASEISRQLGYVAVR